MYRTTRACSIFLKKFCQIGTPAVLTHLHFSAPSPKLSRLQLIQRRATRASIGHTLLMRVPIWDWNVPSRPSAWVMRAALQHRERASGEINLCGKSRQHRDFHTLEALIGFLLKWLMSVVSLKGHDRVERQKGRFSASNKLHEQAVWAIERTAFYSFIY